MEIVVGHAVCACFHWFELCMGSTRYRSEIDRATNRVREALQL